MRKPSSIREIEALEKQIEKFDQAAENFRKLGGELLIAIIGLSAGLMYFLFSQSVVLTSLFLLPLSLALYSLFIGFIAAGQRSLSISYEAINEPRKHALSHSTTIKLESLA